MIFYPQFFAPIHQFSFAAKHGCIELYMDPVFTKNSKANQFEILGANAKHTLSLHLDRNTLKQPLDKVALSDQKDWRKSHLKTIETAYRKAAFYQFYDYKFHPLLELTSLYEAILKSYQLSFAALDLEIDLRWTNNRPNITETPNSQLKSYDQVFSDKLGFQADLCILDLIYNQGPMARDILI